MILGKRIKKIRKYRGMTQRELGMRLGYKEAGADIRIAQYEAGKRCPKKETLYKMAEILLVSPMQFIRPQPGSPEDIMLFFFWVEEEYPDALHLFKLEGIPDTRDKAVKYSLTLRRSDTKLPSVGMYFTYGQLDAYLNEWLVWRECLKGGQVTEAEYMEWKWNWHR